MQLRRILTGLAVLAGTALLPAGAFALSTIPCNSLDCTVIRSGKSSLIVSGEVTGKRDIEVPFPDGKRTMPATEYTITGIVLKGNDLYQAKDDPQIVTVNFVGQVPGPIVSGMLRPQVGSKGLHIFYGNSVLGLTSYAFNTEGFTPYVEGSGGKLLAVSPYGKGLVISNKALAAKFMAVNPAASKLLRAGPVAPVAGEGGEALTTPADGDEDLTPAVMESAVKVILGNNQGNK